MAKQRLSMKLLHELNSKYRSGVPYEKTLTIFDFLRFVEAELRGATEARKNKDV